MFWEWKWSQGGAVSLFFKGGMSKTSSCRPALGALNWQFKARMAHTCTCSHRACSPLVCSRPCALQLADPGHHTRGRERHTGGAGNCRYTFWREKLGVTTEVRGPRFRPSN
eukprot:1161813-Pelagomonas_calceolata.AAC.5